MSRLYIVTLFINFYAEYIMRNAGLEEAQAGIKIARRNINNIKDADFFLWTPISLQMVTAAMKLKDACSWKKSYDKPR